MASLATLFFNKSGEGGLLIFASYLFTQHLVHLDVGLFHNVEDKQIKLQYLKIVSIGLFSSQIFRFRTMEYIRSSLSFL